MSNIVYDLSGNTEVIQPINLGMEIFVLDPIRSIEDISNDIHIVEPVNVESYCKTPYQYALEYGYTGSSESFYNAWITLINNPGGGDGGGVFTENDPTDVTVGGLLENTTILGKTWQEIISLIVYMEKFPTIVAPSFDAAILGDYIFEVSGTATLSIRFTASKGSITPAYGTTGFRSGDINTYRFNNTDIAFQTLIQNYSYVHSMHFVTTQNWLAECVLLAGPQPKSNKGNDYLTPYSATTLSRTLTTYYVFPWFSSSIDITVETKQPLRLMDSDFFETEMISEDEENKQFALFSEDHKVITGIQQYNTFSGEWEWVGGTKNYSLTTFTVTSVTRDINGNDINYLMYTHNGDTIGARKLRFYTI